MIKAVINLEAPREHVYQILTDYPGYKNWLPGCEKCTVLSSSGNASDTEIVVNSMKKMTLGLRFEGQLNQALNFRLLRSKDIRAYSGSYRLMDSADGKGTVVVAEMEIDAGAMVPKFMVDRIAKKSIDETGASLRRYALKAPMKAAAPAVKAAAPGEVAVKARRAKRILYVVRIQGGYRVWMMGESYILKDKAN